MTLSVHPAADPAAEALEAVATAADQAAEAEHEVARRARALGRRRRSGATTVELVRAGVVSAIIASLRTSAHEVLGAARRLQAALAHGLAEEGHTTREIGAHLGVSHQRVSALRRGPRPTAG